ncbi:MAG TPA: hypothetical protein DD723_08120 [Candidatus Omnitrophica bacterium]|nr:MAG: hypothetical protein A2Z81_08075 [Omnitrophica WOR_2 bacterium GWA2_45_18]OGX18623.1 MAG: hypothetical protein A2Y04_03675 [Omnitrophica WOR_2 bacterium GWC2_45_7]HBR15491.1 hypothetical protein [Candidatus Omnitrophota bacterium]
MRSVIKLLRKIFLGVTLLLCLSVQSWALEDAIVAIVNDEIITLRDLRDYIHATYVSLVTEGVDPKTVREIMTDLEVNGINKLVEDKLILSKATVAGIEVREKLVDERLEEIKSQYKSAEQFLEALVKNGSTITELRKKILDQLKIKFIIENEVKSKIFVNPQEVTQYYEKNLEEFQKKERANVDSIYIAFAQDKELARKRAGEALNLIKQNKTFAEVAKEYSDTPSVGTVSKGQLLETVEDTLFRLEPGEVSALIEIDSGIYIFKLNNKIPAQLAGLNEVKDAIYNHIYRNKFRNRLTTWIDTLKKSAYVEIKK